MSARWVLLFAYHFPPENAVGGARPYRFYRYLPRHGYKCHVITAADVSGRPDLDAECVPDPFLLVPTCGSSSNPLLGDRGSEIASEPRAQASGRASRTVADLCKLVLAGQSTGPRYRRKTFGWQTERAIRKLLLPGVIGTQWALNAYRAGSRFLRQHPGDRITVFSTFPPLGTHLAAWLLAGRKRVPWVADFRDPLAGNPLHDSFPAHSRLIYKHLQSALIESAGAFIANTDAAERLLQQQHPARASRVHLIWNGFDPEQRIAALPLPERPFKLLSHVGELYQGRTAVPLLESFARLVDSGRLPAGALRVELTGPIESACMPSPAFRQAAEAQGWLKLRPYQVPKAEALEIAQTSDGLLLIQPQSAVQVPGKLFEYLQIGRPILAFVPRNSSIEGVLEKSGVTYRCVYSDHAPAEIDAVLLNFLALPSNPSRASQWFEETFNAESQTATLAKLIGQL